MAESGDSAGLKPSESVADALWPAIAKAFSNGAFMTFNPGWLGVSGVSSRAGPDRMARLTGSRPARRLAAIVSDLSGRDLTHLLVRSEINLEQALAALRMTLIANISIPLGLFLLANQLAQGSLVAIIADAPVLAILIPFAMAFSLLGAAMWYAYGGVVAARDLNHLLRLHLAATASGAVSSLTEWDAELIPQSDSP
ncbi:hypothetical protein [Hyphomonas sp.]|uniref:hypothetical protein n=1 Tax=Hyphomonas sp. TaxID=87 RepID=UPI003919DCDD